MTNIRYGWRLQPPQGGWMAWNADCGWLEAMAGLILFKGLIVPSWVGMVWLSMVEYSLKCLQMFYRMDCALLAGRQNPWHLTPD